MSKIKAAFADGKAFIPFLTCGDPDLETTEALVRVMAEAGADLIELGIPFSDPTAEGRSSSRPISGRSPAALQPTKYWKWPEAAKRDLRPAGLHDLRQRRLFLRGQNGSSPRRPRQVLPA